MKRLRITLVAIACLATALGTSVAWAQWQWIDKDGRKVFSDQPPPPGTPNDKIVKRPGNRPPEPLSALPFGLLCHHHLDVIEQAFGRSPPLLVQ